MEEDEEEDGLSPQDQNICPGLRDDPPQLFEGVEYARGPDELANRLESITTEPVAWDELNRLSRFSFVTMGYRQRGHC